MEGVKRDTVMKRAWRADERRYIKIFHRHLMFERSFNWECSILCGEQNMRQLWSKITVAPTNYYNLNEICSWAEAMPIKNALCVCVYVIFTFVYANSIITRSASDWSALNHTKVATEQAYSIGWDYESASFIYPWVHDYDYAISTHKHHQSIEIDRDNQVSSINHLCSTHTPHMSYETKKKCSCKLQLCKCVFLTPF